MNRITLKNIKHAAFASEETYCYSATVYFDGKRVGTVRNDGHGGADYEYIENKGGWNAMQDYIDTLPPQNPDEKFTLEPSLEMICHDLVSDWLMIKDMKRAMSKKVLFQKNGDNRVFQSKSAPNAATLKDWIGQVANRDDTAEVLNLLPTEKALEIWRSI